MAGVDANAACGLFMLIWLDESQQARYYSRIFITKLTKQGLAARHSVYNLY